MKNEKLVSIKKSVSFTIHGDPYGKKNMRPVRIGKHISSFSPLENKNYLSRVQDAYFNVVGDEYVNKIFFEQGEAVCASITACYKLQGKHYNKYGAINKEGLAKLSGEIKPTMKPDCDNISKACLDALNGVAFHDDSQVAELHVYKTFSEMPCVVIVLTSLK